jgi:hypothetical protein
MSQAIAVAPPAPAPGFFQRDLVAYAILAAFVVLTLPLVLLVSYDADSPRIRSILLVYLVGMGVSHFVLTPTVYLQSSNLRYFNGSWRNRIIYFAIPIVIFLFFDLYATFQVALLFPVVAIVVRTGIRMLDFQHFSRQTFGVLQLYKVRSGCKFPGWIKRVETQYYFALSLLLLTTFLHGGKFAFDNLAGIVLALAVGVLFGVMATGFGLAHIRSANGREVLLPLAYFLFQTGAALLATYNLAFYGLALAMHYVEYHLLMAPRCFSSKLDPDRPVDQVFGVLRGNKFIFYSLLLFVAFVVFACTVDFTAMLAMLEGTGESARDSRSTSLLFFALFDGLFVFHYFLESFIWRFSEPYYRQTLSPLYFAPRQSAPSPEFCRQPTAAKIPA